MEIPEDNESNENRIRLLAPRSSQVAEVVNLSRSARSKPGVKIGEYALPPER